MKVVNIHTRIIKKPIAEVSVLLDSLSSKDDKIWPAEKWPPIRFREGFEVGSKGGHGPIRYTIEKYEHRKMIQFRFTSPKGFNGIHWFEFIDRDGEETEVKHTIKMNTHGFAVLLWPFVIKWLHDALIEDALDKIEDYFGHEKATKHNLWVRFLRWASKRQ